MLSYVKSLIEGANKMSFTPIIGIVGVVLSVISILVILNGADSRYAVNRR